MTNVIDWKLATSTATRLVPAGPSITDSEARSVVTALRIAAVDAVEPVALTSGLVAPEHSADTVVVDRHAWIRSNIDGLRDGIGPLLERAADARGTPGLVTAVGSRVTAIQLGMALGWLSGRVLGQFEAFHPDDARPRLLLVAPSILAAEERLKVEPRDFRLWVALHEETHRVQFGAVPWLSQHLLGEVEELLALADLPPGELVGRISSAVQSVRVGGTLVEALQSPEQRVIVDRLTAFMSLLEGHADYVMDHTAPDLVPSLPIIRQRFTERRQSPGTMEGVIRRLLGIDAKLRQYSDGAAFVGAVIDEVGLAGFNRVWHSPETLPSLSEIHEPSTWVQRMSAAPLTA